MSKYWLMKSEPEVYSIDQLKKDSRTLWTGVRNYQARNFMQNDMRVGDLVLFYHSNAEPPGIAGIAKVSGVAVPDPTALDKKSEYFDPKATREKPIWFCVEVEFVRKFAEILSLEQLRTATALVDMMVLRKGQRLSVQPVLDAEYKHVLKLAHE